MASVDDVKKRVHEVLVDGGNQHLHPYMLAERMMIEIDLVVKPPVEEDPDPEPGTKSGRAKRAAKTAATAEEAPAEDESEEE